ncbi:Qat anti-phage system QueC-like protein QatC [Nocardia sputi]|uniref:Qat anti-phage system QueC-like protein QatC n=1 Tax=Nocardia sputi TaxID=2943705 RepID=UPI0020C09959|nr:Qat anti-phage system QueC-like protein QatC [Nocardia sputi]
MTTLRVRTDPAEPITAAGVRLLDWAPGRSAATIQASREFYQGWRPTRAAADLLVLGAAVYCADKTTRRALAPDLWTRQLTLEIPTADPAPWRQTDLASTLGFLTGDRWTLEPYRQSRHPFTGIDRNPVRESTIGLDVDAICLFSGGLDSLCGAIDLLERSPEIRVCLLSHHEGGQASTAQQNLLDALVETYGSDRIVSRRLHLRPAPKHPSQARPLPRARENTTRSRSLLFLTTALAMASACGPGTPVYIPENGFIGINVPLTSARVGSASTRTTHPHFLARLAEAAEALEITNPILNPYRHATKGEILAGSANPTLLRHLAPESVSCSHPEAARYVGRRQGNCGYCFPCLIRRASLAHVGWDDEPHAWDVFDPDDRDYLMTPRRRRGADLRAVLTGAFAERPDHDVLRNGPIPKGEHEAFLGVWRRGLAELRHWLSHGPGNQLLDIMADSDD